MIGVKPRYKRIAVRASQSKLYCPLKLQGYKQLETVTCVELYSMLKYCVISMFTHFHINVTRVFMLCVIKSLTLCITLRTFVYYVNIAGVIRVSERFRIVKRNRSQNWKVACMDTSGRWGMTDWQRR